MTEAHKPWTADEAADELSPCEYGEEGSPDLWARMKDARLVAVMGASDDLMEFRGAIYDEVGAYEGATAWVDAKGLLPERDQIDNDEDLKDFFARQPNAVKIEALWDSDGYSWTYKTEIPHATFEVLEGHEPYCRGIVFSLDAPAKAGVS